MNLLAKGIESLRKNGIRETFDKVKGHLKRKEITTKAAESIANFTVSEKTRQKQREHKSIKQPLFSIVTPLYNTPEILLREMIDSVIDQTYGNWELCLADGSGDEYNSVGNIVAQYMEKYPNIKYTKLTKNKGISENTNVALEMVTGDYICFFDHDDLLHPSVLFEYMLVIDKSSVDALYCDEATFEDRVENIKGVTLKPDFAIDNVRCNNYICHFLCVKKEILDKVGKLIKKYDGAQDFDFVLRISEITRDIHHVKKVLYFWRISETSTAKSSDAKPYASEAGRLAVSDHLKRIGLEGEVFVSEHSPYIYYAKYKLKKEPLISIVICNKDAVEILTKCIDSILSLSTYSNYEIIIVENNSETNEIFKYYKKIEKHPKIRVIKYDTNGRFNYSLINNYGVSQAKGEYVLLLNNDIEVITPNWIEEMLMFGQREDVGVVGAKLYYPNDTVQHSGIILGLGGVAGHCHYKSPKNSSGYLGRLIYPQNFSAVTGACMLVKKSIFQDVGGLGEDLAVAFNDVDLCMKIRAKGYLICWTPFAELYHYESFTRGYDESDENKGRFEREINIFINKWNEAIKMGDPYYNPNLSLNRMDFSLK